MQNNPIMIFRLKNFFVSSLDEIYNFFVVMLLGNKSHYKKCFFKTFSSRSRKSNKTHLFDKS